jgi:CRISPR-associated protein Csx10
MTDTLTLRLTFLSDWHVGEGAGAKGHVDAIVRRDPVDQLPFVPAKTLTGILRDGCERVVWGLDSGNEDGPWHRLLLAIFGSDREAADPHTRPAQLSIGPARLDEGLRRALKNKPLLQESLVFLKPGVKLDTEGVAESQMLRFEEVALAGAELIAEATLDLDGEWHDAALALLTAGALTVERLGAKRRRGTGRCQLALEGPGIRKNKELADALSRLPAGEPPDVPEVNELRLGKANRDAAQGWHVLELEMILESPVLIPAATLGNVVTTQDHIPGSLLIPALDHWLAGLLKGDRTLALASGAVQVRNAYPACQGQRLLPVPAAIFKLKEGETFTNHLHGEPEETGHPQRKQQRSGYTGRAGLPRQDRSEEDGPEKPEVRRVETAAITHATLDDRSQRPTEEVGGVFTYQAIRPGQRFLTEVWVSKALVAEYPHDWEKKAPKTIRIGRAKKDDYGRVRLACRKGSPAPVGLIGDGDCLTVWLASPLLLRDDALNPTADPAVLANHLAAELKVTLTQRHRGTPPAGAAERGKTADLAAFARPWRDEGWNNAWQMRRPTRFGLAPGSCFAFAVAGPLDVAALERLQARGLGERRGEGYGELIFNAPLLADSEVRSLARKKDTDQGKAKAAAGAITDFTKALERRAALLAIRRRASELEQAFRIDLGWTGGSNPKPPPNTQLGALRALLEPLRDAAGLTRLSTWLTALRGNETRNEKWPNVTKTALETHIANGAVDAIWSALGLPAGPDALSADRRTTLKRELRCEAIRALWLAAISRQLNENNRTAQNSSQTAGDSHGA